MALPVGYNHLQTGKLRTAYLARAYRIKRTTGAIERYTSHDSQLTIPEHDRLAEGDLETYEPALGVWTQAQRREAGLRELNTEVRGVIDSSAISETDLEAGLYHRAEVIEYIVDWRWPWIGYFSFERYFIGETQYSGEFWSGEMHGLAQQLRRPQGATGTANCKYDFGSSRCAKNRGLNRRDMTISTVTNRQVFTCSTVPQHPVGGTIEAGGSGHNTTDPRFLNYFRNADITWTSGSNSTNGITSRVRSYDKANQEFTLVEPVPYDLAIGTTFQLVTSCGKDPGWCEDFHANLANFGGNPYAPGPDKTTRPPGVR